MTMASGEVALTGMAGVGVTPEGSSRIVIEDFGDTFYSGRPPLTKTVTVRFDEETMGLLQVAAEARGLGVTTLVRQWIQERLGIDWQAGKCATPTSDLPEGFESLLRERIVARLLETLPDVAEDVLKTSVEMFQAQNKAQEISRTEAVADHGTVTTAS